MTQPPTGPPQGPPWGYYPPPAPPPSKGHGWQILGGAVIGGFATLVLPFLTLGVAGSMGLGLGALLMAFVLVPLTAIALLFSDSTRPWGTGLLIGWAMTLIVAAGACVALFSGLS